MDVTWDWDETRRFVILVGLPRFLKYLQEKFWALGLYSVSGDWISNRAYVAKARGKNGDLIIQWKTQPELGE